MPPSSPIVSAFRISFSGRAEILPHIVSVLEPEPVEGINDGAVGFIAPEGDDVLVSLDEPGRVDALSFVILSDVKSARVPVIIYGLELEADYANPVSV